MTRVLNKKEFTEHFQKNEFKLTRYTILRQINHLPLKDYICTTIKVVYREL